MKLNLKICKNCRFSDEKTFSFGMYQRNSFTSTIGLSFFCRKVGHFFISNIVPMECFSYKQEPISNVDDDLLKKIMDLSKEEMNLRNCHYKLEHLVEE